MKYEIEEESDSYLQRPAKRCEQEEISRNLKPSFKPISVHNMAKAILSIVDCSSNPIHFHVHIKLISHKYSIMTARARRCEKHLSNAAQAIQVEQNATFSFPQFDCSAKNRWPPLEGTADDRRSTTNHLPNELSLISIRRRRRPRPRPKRRERDWGRGRDRE